MVRRTPSGLRHSLCQELLATGESSVETGLPVLQARNPPQQVAVPSRSLVDCLEMRPEEIRPVRIAGRWGTLGIPTRPVVSRAASWTQK